MGCDPVQLVLLAGRSWPVPAHPGQPSREDHRPSEHAEIAACAAVFMIEHDGLKGHGHGECRIEGVEIKESSVAESRFIG